MQQSDLSSFPFLDAAGKDEHLLNTSLHILTLELISTFVKDKHLLNTLFPMKFTEVGIIISFNDEQSSKVHSLITINEDESDTINNEEHFEKSKI
ncbi:hypothetical protein M9Y10_039207 [Tritrichomonas musculus]|uniref:Uncharacterized protein n=1 Tax=Tritrichomonas musculus TaxID=1915356 RepID=A0ABR2KAP4_9EUKA